jgi:hypothetical protein
MGEQKEQPMNAQIKTASLTRDSYGAICEIRVYWNDQPNLGLIAARELVRKAEAGKKIPAAYDTLTRDRKGRWDGYALHHEIYDFNNSAVLLCLRETEGTRYGVRTVSKRYVIVRKHGSGVVVAEAPKAVAAKAAKAKPEELGYAIAVCLGKEKLKGKAMEKRIGYKLVERTEDGGYRSCWDGSPWVIGKSRTEKAEEKHSGGLFYYRTLDDAMNAAAINETFGKARQHRRLAVLEVEASGREIEYSGSTYTKLCATRIKPLRDVATTL